MGKKGKNNPAAYATTSQPKPPSKSVPKTTPSATLNLKEEQKKAPASSQDETNKMAATQSKVSLDMKTEQTILQLLKDSNSLLEEKGEKTIRSMILLFL